MLVFPAIWPYSIFLLQLSLSRFVLPQQQTPSYAYERAYSHSKTKAPSGRETEEGAVGSHPRSCYSLNLKPRHGFPKVNLVARLQLRPPRRAMHLLAQPVAHDPDAAGRRTAFVPLVPAVVE